MKYEFWVHGEKTWRLWSTGSLEDALDELFDWRAHSSTHSFDRVRIEAVQD